MQRKATPTPEVTKQVTLSVLGLVLFTAALLSGFFVYGVAHQDRSALQKQKLFLEEGLRDAVKDARSEIESVTYWDDAVTYAKAGDQAWLSENLSVWMHDFYGFDRVYLLDQSDQPVHAMRDGKVVDRLTYGEDAGALRAVVASLRRVIKEKAAAEAVAMPAPLQLDAIVTLGGKPALVVAAPIAPSTDRVPQASGTEYVDLSVKFLDSVVGKIGQKYRIADARVSTADAVTEAHTPIVAGDGGTIAQIVWNPETPGLSLVTRIAPALVVAALIWVGLLIYLLGRLRRAFLEVQASQNEAEYLALHDVLTGLANRALFNDRLEHALQEAARSKRRVALLYLDLDRFKHVNDTLGHPAGDELIRQTATRVSQAIRRSDTVARLGGDEFAIILGRFPNFGFAETVCERLLSEINVPYDLNGDIVFASASIGLAYSAEGSLDTDELLRRSDIALYEAKRRGRGRYEVFANDMEDLLLRRRMIESDLRAALADRDSLKLVFQPVFAEDCQQLRGAEAQINWHHQSNGTLTTTELIGVAEERGLINALGDWALVEAARACALAGLPWVSVSVWKQQLRDERFAVRVAEILYEAGLDGRRLQVDVSEALFLDQDATIQASLRALRDLGVRVALDHFGVGDSSLLRLRRGGADKLKIDGSLVSMLGGPDDSTPIVNAFFEFAKAIGMDVAADGIETDAQRAALVQMGCRELQGPLLGGAVEAGALRQPGQARASWHAA